MKIPTRTGTLAILLVTVLISCGQKKTGPENQKNEPEVKVNEFKVTYGERSHTREITETDLDKCETDSICKTFEIKRWKEDKIKMIFPAKDLATQVVMYDATMKTEILKEEAKKGQATTLEWSFTKIDDGTYKIKYKRSDNKKRVFKLVILTEEKPA